MDKCCIIHNIFLSVIDVLLSNITVFVVNKIPVVFLSVHRTTSDIPSTARQMHSEVLSLSVMLVDQCFLSVQFVRKPASQNGHIIVKGQGKRQRYLRSCMYNKSLPLYVLLFFFIENTRSLTTPYNCFLSILAATTIAYCML
jgi:hypothetical protein